jgi:hypothetical protein
VKRGTSALINIEYHTAKASKNVSAAFYVGDTGDLTLVGSLVMSVAQWKELSELLKAGAEGHGPDVSGGALFDFENPGLTITEYM